MDVSVILCTWNNSARLGVTLRAFLDLEFSEKVSWELVVVNNNSTDATCNIVNQYTESLPIKYVEEPKQGLSHARNAGLANASGDLVVFTDDDIRPCKGWLDTYWKAYRVNTDGYFWGGPIVSEFEEPPKDMELIRLAPCSVRGLDWGPDERFLAEGEFFISANWGCPAKYLATVGGFDPSLGLNPDAGKVLVGEENDLMNRLTALGLKALYLPEASIQHFVPKSKMTLDHIASRVEASGRTLANVNDGKTTAQIFGIPRWMFFRIIVLLKDYWLARATGKHGYKEYLSYRRLRGNLSALFEQRNNIL